MIETDSFGNEIGWDEIDLPEYERKAFYQREAEMAAIRVERENERYQEYSTWRAQEKDRKENWRYYQLLEYVDQLETKVAHLERQLKYTKKPLTYTSMGDYLNSLMWPPQGYYGRSRPYRYK